MASAEETKIEYPKAVAQDVCIRRPDLAADVSAVLTADPTLTADEVIEALDEAKAEHAGNVAAEER